MFKSTRTTEAIEIRHSGISLEDRKNVPCTYSGCNKLFTKKSNLSAHVRTAHKGQRFICGQFNLSRSEDIAFWDGQDACGREFVSKVNLEDHVRTQHAGLPSVVNAKRTKAGKGQSTGKTKKGKKAPVSAIDELTGRGMTHPDRNISCTVAGCSWMFTRHYDLENHVRTKHKYNELDTDIDHAPGFVNDTEVDGDMPFWIGAEEEPDTEFGDQWMQDEPEMRSLIDPDGFHELDSLLDPVLQGL